MIKNNDDFIPGLITGFVVGALFTLSFWAGSPRTIYNTENNITKVGDYVSLIKENEDIRVFFDSNQDGVEETSFTLYKSSDVGQDKQVYNIFDFLIKY